jgi:hypothetical protein
MRKDQAGCTLIVNGRRIPIEFSKRSGGSRDSDELKYRRGRMKKEEAFGGPPTTDNVTLVGLFDPRINNGDLEYLESVRGAGKAQVLEQVLDEGGTAIDTLPPWKGILKKVDRGEYDSSGSEAREVELEVSTSAD